MNFFVRQIVTLLFLTIPLLAQDWIKQSIELTINTQFTKAESLLTARMEKGDSSLAVYFYYASVLNSQMTHFENKDQNDSFEHALQQVVNRGASQLEDTILPKKEKARTLFYVGSAYGYLAFYQGQIGAWFSAVKNGNRAADYLEEAIEADSTLWDAYLGLGAYKYWLSTKVDWIPFIPDRREEGIDDIYKTIRYNGHSKYMAMHQLIYILLDFGRFNEAEEFAEEIVAAYPKSIFMRWAHTHVYMKEKNFPKAIASYKALLDLIAGDPNANPNHKMTALGRLADMYARADSCGQALKIIDSLKSIENKKLISMNDEVRRLMNEVLGRCDKTKRLKGKTNR